MNRIHAKKRQMSCGCTDFVNMSGGGSRRHSGGSGEFAVNLVNLAIPVGYALAAHALGKAAAARRDASAATAAATAAAPAAAAPSPKKGAKGRKQRGGSECGMCTGMSGGGMMSDMRSDLEVLSSEIRGALAI